MALEQSVHEGGTHSSIHHREEASKTCRVEQHCPILTALCGGKGCTRDQG